MWKVDLKGSASDILVLRELAACCDCALVAGPDGHYCLGGARFQEVSNAQEMRAQAEQVLNLSNGLARMENPEHRPVRVGEFAYGESGLPVRIGSTPASRSTSIYGIFEYAPPGSHTSDMPVTRDDKYERRRQIVSDPNLAEILETIAGDISWQRLRVAFEKVTALVGKSDNALVKRHYASRDELETFKANVEDPRHSGLAAVHARRGGPLKGHKMTEREGLEFVVGLINTYVSRKHPS